MSEQLEKQVSQPEHLLEVRDLKQYFPIHTGWFQNTPLKAVDGVSFTIDAGETLGLVGESGCGKLICDIERKRIADQSNQPGKQTIQQNVQGNIKRRMGIEQIRPHSAKIYMVIDFVVDLRDRAWNKSSRDSKI